jgi:hypothetical protein
MVGLSEAFKTQIDSESWDSIARMALNFQVELSKDDKEAVRLRKKLAVIKHMIHTTMKDPENADRIKDASFFVSLFRTVESLEKDFEKQKLRRNEFLFFLNAVLQKVKSEKLVVHKVLERKNEFKRMKKE